MTPTDVAKNILLTNPKASPGTVRRLAAQWSDDPGFLDEVVGQYMVLRMKTTRFAEEVLPEEKC